MRPPNCAGFMCSHSAVDVSARDRPQPGLALIRSANSTITVDLPPSMLFLAYRGSVYVKRHLSGEEAGGPARSERVSRISCKSGSPVMVYREIKVSWSPVVLGRQVRVFATGHFKPWIEGIM